MKKYKSCTPNQPSSSNGSAEVFVLPPDLLAKLGISLNNIQQSELAPPATTHVKDAVQKSVDHKISKHLSENEDTSSIIQTATLMKESLFLSPTFLQTTPIVVPDKGEPIVIDEPTISMDPTISSECGTLSHQCNRNCVTVTEINSIGEQSASQILNDSIVIKSNTRTPLEVVIEKEDQDSIKEYQVENHDGDLILTDVSYQNSEKDKISNDISNTAITVDEHPDEAYLSDCSNSYSGSSPKSINSEVNKQNLLHKNKNEEIPKVVASDTLQLQNIEEMNVICPTSDDIFTPGNINTIITLHDDPSDLGGRVKQPAVIATIESIVDEPTIQASHLDTVQNGPSEKTNSYILDNAEIEAMNINIRNHTEPNKLLDENKKIESDDVTIVLVETPAEINPESILIIDKQDSKNPSQENTELISIAEVHNSIETCNSSDKKTLENIGTNDSEKNNSVTESSQDRVKEIATYLSQIANERKNINKKKFRKTEKEAKDESIISKLCIEGVEKPGGKLIKLECASVSRTYQRAFLKKHIPNRIKIFNAVLTTNSSQKTDNLDLQSHGKKVETLDHQNEFCKCYDFGNLAYYDCEMLYEHIHFWSHKNIEYDPETLYSIYDEASTILKQSVDFIEDTHQNECDSNTTIKNTLCWNEINLLKDNEKPEAGLSTGQQPIMNEEIDSGTTPKPSTSAETTQKSANKSNSNTPTPIKSNNDDINVPGNSTSASASETALSKQSVDVAEVKVPNLTKNTSESKIMVPSISGHTPLTSKKQSNNMEVCPKVDFRVTRKSSLNTDLNTANLSTTSNKTDRSQREHNRSADIPTHTSKTSKRVSKAKTDSLKTLPKSIENSNTKLAIENDKKDPTQGFLDKANTLENSQATDIKTCIKSVRKTSDTYINTASKSSKSTNNINQEIITGTKKRPSSTAMVNPPVKKMKATESLTIIEVVDDKSMKHRKVVHPKYTKEQEPPAGPSKVEIIDSMEQDRTVEITIEESTINYDSMDTTTVEESTIPDESVAVPMESSTMSPEAAMNILQSTEYYMVLEPMPENMIKCGVCEKKLEEKEWIQHICKEHNYLAWRDGEPPLDLKDENHIKKYLQHISYKNKGLECSKCGAVRKMAQRYLDHIKTCNAKKLDLSREQDEEYIPLLELKSRKYGEKVVAPPPYTCGVCNETVEQSAWIEHIQLEHKYLAWTSEEQPLNLDDPQEVKEHLKYISKHHGGLTCNSCSVRWNYAKKYLSHISKCETGNVNKIVKNRKCKKPKLVVPPIVTCGVCKMDVEGKQWIKHIQVAHQYVAWIGGEEPLDPEDEEQMKGHLDMIVASVGELVCMNCGQARKFTRSYLQHIAACAKTGFHLEFDEPVEHKKNEYVCGVCHVKGKLSEWNSHAMSKHYNVAWKVGDVPINLRNFYAVDKLLKLYKKKHSLVCNNCRATRTSGYGFYAHVLTCGKTEEEIDSFHDLCEVCDKKYLCIYRNQHMAAHRDSDQRRERREMLARKAEEEAWNPPEPPDSQPTGKRKAAEKAKKVIQKHSSNTVDGMPVCGCGATFKDAKEFSQHSCLQQTKDEDGSDVSVKLENESEESADEIVDSGVSDEEEENYNKKKKRVRVGEGSTKAQRMPYRVSNYTSYLYEGYKDFVKSHYTTQRLFNEWRDSEYEVVSGDEMAKYLPQLTESCKVRLDSKSSDEWVTYKRFEAKKMKGVSIFTGGAIQCIAWAPPNPEDETLGNYLVVSTHRGPDVPRYSAGDRPQHPASLQIWNFGVFNMMPRCALCLAHEYGVVWAMDWCPSGARDTCSLIVPDEYDEYTEESTANYRLGLLAIACSNGSAYILAVPCPPESQEQDPVMYKLKPVAELRLTMTPERRIYQATSIKWSPQKGHSIIIVGYSDGTTALYDLNTESPFLTATEKGVAIFYPFQDRQPESTSVTGVGVFVTKNESYPIGGQFSTSMSGGTMCGAGAGARPAARVHLAVSGALPATHWPAVELAGDPPFMRSVSEMEWWGGGRRVGAGRAWAACARCGRAASAAPPALRSHRHHPAYPDIKKVIVAMLLMVPIGQNKKRKVNDDLSVVVEPLTYEDAAAKYGLELTFVTKSSKSQQTQAQHLCNDNEFRPERFPLSDIVALAFCPSGRFHERIAVATHTGLIFVIIM